MATSGTVSFKVNRDTLIKDALIDAGLIAIVETPEDDLMAFASRKLNLMLKTWMTEVNLWKIRPLVLILQKDQSDYTIGPTGDHASELVIKSTLTVTAATSATSLSLSTTGMTVGDNIGIVLDTGYTHWTTIATIPSSINLTISSGLTSQATSGNTVFSYTTKVIRPLAIWDLIRKDKNDNDIPVNYISRTEYSMFSRKTTTGTPSNISFQPTLTNDKLKVYPAPSVSTDRLVAEAQYPVEDLTASNHDFDCPQEWLLPIQLNLAVLLTPAAATVSTEYKKLVDLATQYKEIVTGWDRELTPTRIIPSETILR